MIRRYLFLLLGLASACSLFTDLDGFAAAGPDAAAPDVVVPDASADVSADAAVVTCAPGKDFTSDPKHCGRCGHDCLGGQCFEGTCQPVLLANATTSHIRVDATHAYFADSVRQIVSRVPKRGGQEQTLATSQFGLYEFDVNDSHVYFMSDYGVRRVPKAGGAVEDIAPTNEVRFILLSGEDLFWSGWLDDKAGKSSIWRSRLDGSATQLVAGGRTGVETLAREGDDLYYGENGQNGTTGAVRVISLVTKEDRLLAEQKCRRLAIDASNVYFLDYLTPVVWTVPRAGGAAAPIANSVAGVFATDIVIDDSFVYWGVSNVPGGVFRVSKTGGAVTPITEVPEGSATAVDDVAIYWSHKDKPGVYMVAKP